MGAGNLYFLGDMVNGHKECEDLAKNTIWMCLRIDSSVVDDDTLLACFASHLSIGTLDCHDYICDLFADHPFFNCP